MDVVFCVASEVPPPDVSVHPVGEPAAQFSNEARCARLLMALAAKTPPEPVAIDPTVIVSAGCSKKKGSAPESAGAAW